MSHGSTSRVAALHKILADTFDLTEPLIPSLADEFHAARQSTVSIADEPRGSCSEFHAAQQSTVSIADEPRVSSTEQELDSTTCGEEDVVSIISLLNEGSPIKCEWYKHLSHKQDAAEDSCEMTSDDKHTMKLLKLQHTCIDTSAVISTMMSTTKARTLARQSSQCA